MRSISSLFGVETPFDPQGRYVTSWLLRPAHLAAVRLVLALYAFVVTFVQFGLESATDAQQSFSYFTHLTYWGLAFYMLVAGVHTAFFAHSRGTHYPLQRWPKVLQGMHVCFYAATVVYPVIVTVTFWVILYAGKWFPTPLEQWSNISQHGLNSLYMLVETFLTQAPIPAPLTVPVLVAVLCLYLGLAYITYDTEGFYPYAFLDPAKGSAERAEYIVGILVASVIVWGIVCGLIWLRQKLTHGKQKGVAGDVHYLRSDPEKHGSIESH